MKGDRREGDERGRVRKETRGGRQIEKKGRGRDSESRGEKRGREREEGEMSESENRGGRESVRGDIEDERERLRVEERGVGSTERVGRD